MHCLNAEAVEASAGAAVAHTVVRVAEEALDATAQCSDGYNSHNGDQADQQRVLHHGGPSLGPCPLEQITVESAHCEERVQKQFSHSVIPLFLPQPPRTIVRIALKH